MQPRRQKRYAVQLPVTFSGPELSGQGTVVNVSMEGCAIISQSIPPLSSYVTLSIELPTEPLPVTIDLGVVRWRTEIKFGIEIIRMDPSERERLQQLVKTLEADPVT